MSASVHRGLRTASKSLRLQQTCLQAARPLVASRAAALLAAPRSSPSSSSSSSHITNFHTMASLQSNAPVTPSEGRGYDPEIKDIADYIHNKPIDSELAVSPYRPAQIFYPAHFFSVSCENRG